MAPRPKKKLFSRRKTCKFCSDQELVINYKEVKTLRSFVSERGKIIPRRIVGTCATHQRKLCEAIKQARQIAFLPYSGSSQN
ncbi:MAG: 30S ribosomal protein S18 [Deltaproteobacteria bacterium]|nr:MAG: 30S ribosomal protein S18 [Deltaproteobacteria bacterium]